MTVSKWFVALLFLLLGCGESTHEVESDVRIGLLLPYTGRDGSAGGNYERGVLMAVDAVNQAGGIGGKHLHVLYADTHSSVERGIEGAQRLIDQHVVAIIGPENDELARALSPMLAEAQVALLTPSSSSVPTTTAATNLWFRLAPSAWDLGIALGRRMAAAGVHNVAIVHTDSQYERIFGSGVEERLLSAGVRVESLEVKAGATGFTEAIRATSKQTPDAVVLAADVVTGSRFVNDYAFVAGWSKGVNWYLSPSLEHEDFVLNTLPQALEGMVGVSAAVTPDRARTDAFTQAFGARWAGATPTTGAFYYYDALALLSIAYEGASYQSQGEHPAASVLRDAVLSASGHTGVVVTWDQLGRGVARASEGRPVYYSGVTGVISLDRSGSRADSYTRFWTVRHGSLEGTEL